MYRNSILFISFILVLSLAMSVTEGADPSLVGLWSFDEGAGITAFDMTAYGNDGTLQGGPQWVNGKLAMALQFDGVDDFVEVPHAAILTVDTEVAVMAWINAQRHNSAGGDWQAILAKSNDPRSYSFYTHSSGTLHFSTTSGGGYVGSNSSGQVPLNEWVHVCAMVSGGQHVYYINGQPAGTSQSGINLPGAADTATVRIGVTHEGGNNFLGMIDDARIYNRALTQQEIQEAMLGADTQAARNPNPAHLAVDVAVDANLTWTRGDGADSDQVYFGTDPCSMPLVANLLTIFQPEYNPPGDLIASTTYSWQIVEVNDAVQYPGP
ncbi:MAG: LamG domain-containing protein, partial [Planctomycetes bacterium]|nr:LamG domain-containing protein [Planctomycetota bacterium]